MNVREKWLKASDDMWRPLRATHEEGCIFRMSVCKLNSDLVLKTYFNNFEASADYHRIYGLSAIVVGIDIREWTRRDFAVQSFINMNLHKNIRKIINNLRKGGIIGFYDPIHISYTGDGAIIIFGGKCSESPFENRIDCKKSPKYQCLETDKEPCVEKELSAHCDEDIILAALSFVFSFNALTQQDNYEDRFKHVSGTVRENEYLPLYLRYAISYGQILPITDALDNLQFVGAPMLTCSRILSTDQGNHFLIDAKLLHEINKYGGLSRIGCLKHETCWDQELFISELPEKKVKSGFFRYADVMGYHSDGPLLVSLGKTTVVPARYQIGSHDTRVID